MNDGAKRRGLIAYASYAINRHFRTFDGRPIPSWSDLDSMPNGPGIQAGWIAAAEAVYQDTLRVVAHNRED